MKAILRSAIEALSLLLTAMVLSVESISAQTSRDAVIEHASRRAIPLTHLELNQDFADFSALGELIGDAQVVSLGEAYHGGHQFLALRNRLFAYLAEEAGFTAIALETGFVSSIPVDDHVQSTGDTSTELVTGMFSFGAPYAYRENQQLIQWIQDYNSRPDTSRKLRIYGLDMIGRMPAMAPDEVTRSLDWALDYLARRDRAEGERFQEQLGQILRVIDTEGYAALDAGQQDVLTVAIADLVAAFERHRAAWIAESSHLDYERAYRNAILARGANADLRTAGWWGGETGNLNQRDAVMADQVRWALEQEARDGRGGRILVFAHNGHVRTAGNSEPGVSYTSMGEHLRLSLGSNLFTIGTVSANRIGFPASATPAPDSDSARPEGVNELLSELDLPIALIDLAPMSDAPGAADWWNQPRPLQYPEYPGWLRPARSFDALIFIDTVERLSPLR